MYHWWGNNPVNSKQVKSAEDSNTAAAASKKGSTHTEGSDEQAGRSQEGGQEQQQSDEQKGRSMEEQQSDQAPNHIQQILEMVNKGQLNPVDATKLIAALPKGPVAPAAGVATQEAATSQQQRAAEPLKGAKQQQKGAEDWRRGGDEDAQQQEIEEDGLDGQWAPGTKVEVVDDSGNHFADGTIISANAKSQFGDKKLGESAVVVSITKITDPKVADVTFPFFTTRDLDHFRAGTKGAVSILGLMQSRKLGSGLKVPMFNINFPDPE
jgi:hypothetical protein